MSRVRTFLAVEVSSVIRSRLRALQESLNRAGLSARWVSPESIHLTLLFLGDIDERDLNRLCRGVAEVCSHHTAFSLSVEGVGCFPNVERPRVVWAGVGEGVEELHALHEELSDNLSEAGLYDGDVHRFHPHVTLGRVKNFAGLAAALETKTAWSAGTCRIEEVKVMASDPRPEGPIYSVLSSANFTL